MARYQRKKPAEDPLADLPPYSEEAEMGVVGCIMLSADTLDACAEHGLEENWFYDFRNKTIYRAAKALYESGGAVDDITMAAYLKSLPVSGVAKSGDMLESVGGVPYMMKCRGITPTAANVDYYLAILKEKWLLRRMVQIGQQMHWEVFDKSKPVSAGELLGRVEKEVLKLGENRAGACEVRIKQAIQTVLDELDDYHRGKPQLKGIATGLEYVDKLLCGIGGRNGNYFVLSGRPGTGKTSLVTQIAMHVALDYVWFDPVTEVVDGLVKPVMESTPDGDRFKTVRKVGMPVGIFSLEMATDALVHRMLFQQAGADMQRWRTGYAVNEDVMKLTAAAAKMVKPDNIFIDDESRCTIDTLRSKARRMFRQHGIKLFIVDYIQLMRGGKRYREDRVQELAEISNEIQALGKEFYVPIVVLAQMNRDYEKDPNRAPRLSDLKDCGSIEQDADVVGFLYRPKLKDGEKDAYDKTMEREFGDDWSKYPTRVNCLFAKNRYGPTGDTQMLFQRSCTRFADWVAWMKSRGQLPPAKGESKRELPSNQEMGIE